MDLRLGGKRALITGSSTGIGAAIACRLAAEGAAVLVHGRRAAAVHKLVDQIAAAGGRATGTHRAPATSSSCAVRSVPDARHTYTKSMCRWAPTLESVTSISMTAHGKACPCTAVWARPGLAEHDRLHAGLLDDLADGGLGRGLVRVSPQVRRRTD